MSTKVATDSAGQKVKPVDLSTGPSGPQVNRLDLRGRHVQTTAGVPLCVMLREAVEETGWKLDALAQHLDINSAYVSRMLTGEKPISDRHLRMMPPDVREAFARKYAEAHGLAVVQRVDRESAYRHLAIALFTLLAPELPERTTGMIPVERRARDRRRA